MTWREDMLPASWRGVPFYAQDIGGDRGRRYARHEYPGRDQPFIEDLGRRAREETVEAFVIGADHIDAAKKLIAACEQPGPATLVHPYLGRMTVICTGCRPAWSTREGGMTRLSLTFAEAGQRRYPESRAENGSKVAGLAGQAQSAIGTALAAVSQLRQLPSYIAEAASSVVGAAADAVWGAIGSEAMTALERAGLSRDILALARDASQLVFSPATLASRVSGLLSADRWIGVVADAALGSGAGATVRGIIGGVSGISWRAYARLFDFDGGDAVRPMPVGAVTTNRQREAVIVAAHTALIRKTALVEASRAAVAVAAEIVDGDSDSVASGLRRDFDSVASALTVRDTLARRLEAETKQALSDGEFRALRDLRIAVVRAITDAAPRLPLLTTVRAPTTLPAIVLAHRLWGDGDITALAAQADAMVSRNRLRHPLFVPAQQPLQVVRAAGGSQ